MELPRQAGTQRTEDKFMTQLRRQKFVEIGEHISPTVCLLTVSTRGIGFVISRVTSMLRQRYPDYFPEIPVAEIYRASLAQLHAKMCYRNLTTPVFFDGIQYERLACINGLFYDTLEMIRHHFRANLSQVAVIIDTIGNVSVNNKTFVPVFTKELTPLNIRLDNLRRYCEEMSNSETEPARRVAGFELNSIPNAQWERTDENDPESVVLRNPDDIIPRNYGSTEIQNDLHTHRRLLEEIRCRTVPELLADINCNNAGDPGFLVSTHVIPGQSLKLNNNVISGAQSEFWSTEPISHASWCAGVVSLVGEVLNPMDGSARSNIEGRRAILNWHGISDMIF